MRRDDSHHEPPSQRLRSSNQTSMNLGGMWELVLVGSAYRVEQSSHGWFPPAQSVELIYNRVWNEIRTAYYFCIFNFGGNGRLCHCYLLNTYPKYQKKNTSNNSFHTSKKLKEFSIVVFLRNKKDSQHNLVVTALEYEWLLMNRLLWIPPAYWIASTRHQEENH